MAVTAFAMVGDERKTLESGCDGYLSKPIRCADLLDMVEKFLGTACARPTSRADDGPPRAPREGT